jgi:hypothetical protein
MEHLIKEYTIRYTKFKKHIDIVEKECDGMWDCCGIWRCGCDILNPFHEISDELNDLSNIDTDFIKKQLEQHLERMSDFCIKYDDKFNIVNQN